MVLTSLLFLSAYYFVYFKAQSFLSELVTNAAYYGAQIRGKAYPLYLIGRAGAGDGPAMAVVTAVVLVLFVLLFWLLSRSFLRIATASGSTVRRVYREKTAVQRGAGTALLARELRHFGGNPSYMLNCGLGILLMPLGGTALLWKRDLLDVLQPMVGGQGIALILCALVCLLASMNLMAAPSVSLEGRTLWLVQSLPVRPWQVLRAKLQLQLVLTAVPALIAAVCGGTAPYTFEKSGAWTTLRGGEAAGELIGGLLTNFALMLGGRWLRVDRTKKYILFLEDHETFGSPGAVAKYLAHVEQSGFMNHVSGLIFGRYSDDSHPEIGEILYRTADRFGIPAVTTGDFGHGAFQGALPVGVSALLDADAQTLQITENVVEA